MVSFVKSLKEKEKNNPKEMPRSDIMALCRAVAVQHSPSPAPPQSPTVTSATDGEASGHLLSGDPTAEVATRRFA